MKQTVKKKTAPSISITQLKNELGLSVKNMSNLEYSTADKDMEFIPMPEAFENALRLPGFPMGYMSIITGWSNTGKSTLKNCLIASCINNGILPVIYDTENNFNYQYAIDCGMKATPIYEDVDVEYIDEETGEVTVKKEKKIIDYCGDYVLFDSNLLAAKYGYNDYSTGKQVKTKRKIAVIEDIAYSINEFLDLQDEGKIQQPICFIWDSVGSIPSYRSLTSKTGNNMFDANALSTAFNVILNNRIPVSRRVSEPYTNSFVCVNKIWNDSMNSPQGLPSVELKGGKSFYYAARLIIHLGGQAKSSVKKLNAIAKGETYNYGIISKVKVTKNQLPSPYNISYEGEIACVHNGLCNPEKIDAYKKTYMKDLLAKITSANRDSSIEITENDIEFDEKEEIDNE